jgi:hypothetical protein
MKSPFYFIVKPNKNKRYDNTVDFDGVEFISSTSKEDFKFSNREAIVVETPINYNGPVTVGDRILVHHNVFKYYNDMKGRERSGKSFLKDNLFFVDESQFFAYTNDSQNSWKCINDYCFVKPVATKDYYISKLCPEEPLYGIMEFTNSNLESLGVKKGDEVCFEPESEYEFTVDGNKLYRMYTRNITLVK